MTEKRFWYDFEDCNGAKIVDFVEDKEYSLETIGDFRKIEDLLNSLSEENEQLKQQLFEARKDYLIETADISDKLYLDELIENERKEIFE